MIKVAIIENDENARKYLSSILAALDIDILITGYASTIKEGISLLNKVNPDILFLDIELDDGLSFEILDRIDTTTMTVIFTTGFDTYYKEAMEHFALSYLLKPVDVDKLKTTLSRYKVRAQNSQKQNIDLFKQLLETKNKKLFLHVSDSYIPVAIEDIILCIADGNYTQFHLKNGTTHEANGIIKHYEKLLQSNSFFRANRSTLVNISHIVKIHKKETIIMNTNLKVPVASRRRQELDLLLKSLI